MLLDKFPDRRIALEHPRSVVEQTGRIPERREVDFDLFASGFLHSPHCAPECIPIRIVAEEGKILLPRNAELPVPGQGGALRKNAL